jgi:PAS domain S-box-containing protein
MKDNYRILVLDDDQNQRELLKSFLELSGPYWVDTVGYPDQFWQKIEFGSYDMIFLDYKLPGANGLDILTSMTERSIPIPVIMMSGVGDERIAAQAIQRGAVDYIVKGEDILSGLPTFIQKAINVNELKLSIERSLEQIRYQAMVLDNVRDAVVVWDLTGKITYWNPAAHILFGWSADERIGKSVHEVYLNAFHPPAYVPKLEDSSGFVIEREYTTKDGHRIWVSSRLTPLRSEKNTRQLIGYMDVSRDVTQRRVEQQALKESQRFVQKIVDTTPNILYIFDLEKKACVFCNRESVTVLGLTPTELQEMSIEHIIELVHPNDLQAASQFLQEIRHMADGQILEVEFRVKDQDGQWHWLLTRNRVFWRGLDGSSQQIFGVAQDITARKLTEERLERRVEIETIIASISTNFLNIDVDRFYEGIEDALVQLNRFVAADCSWLFIRQDASSTSQVMIQCASDVFWQAGHESSIGRLSRWLMNRFPSGSGHVIIGVESLPVVEPEIQQAFNELDIRSLVLVPVVYNKKVAGILGFASLTDRKTWRSEDIGLMKTAGNILMNALAQNWAETAVRDSESRYRAIVEDHQTEMIFRFLPDSTITFVNETFCQVFGQDRANLLGTKVESLLPEESRAYFQELLQSASPVSPVKIAEIWVGNSGLFDRWHEWTIRAIFTDSAVVDEFQTVGRDITERKQMEAQIKEAQTKLTQATRLAAIGELAAGVAHQINNPLTTIIAEAQILGMRLRDDAEGSESTQAIEAAGWQAQRVVQELMKFSQSAPNEFGMVEINQTIQTAITLVGADIEAKGISLNTQFCSEELAINGNESQLEDLWINLLLVLRSFPSNKMMRCIQVKTYIDQDQIVVDFSDDGYCISAEDLDRIFEPSLIPTSNHSITGMELSICREITRQNHGEILVHSNQKDTTFQVKFLREVSNATNQHIGD